MKTVEMDYGAIEARVLAAAVGRIPDKWLWVNHAEKTIKRILHKKTNTWLAPMGDGYTTRKVLFRHFPKFVHNAIPILNIAGSGEFVPGVGIMLDNEDFTMYECSDPVEDYRRQDFY